MTKLKFSDTQRFNDIKKAIINTCTFVAVMNCNDYSHEDKVEDQIDATFHVLDIVFEELSLSDTETRRAGKMAVYEVLKNVPKDGNMFKYIEDNIDCSMVLDDVLHMMTCDSDEFEYEGGNAMYAILEQLETA
jgi:hypothetical protein